jgi:hypothetical protein
MLQFVLILTIALPIAWFVSEFDDRRWLRILCGVLALSMSFGVAYLAGSLDRLNSNAWFGAASADLIDATVHELENGDPELVVSELKALREQFHPTYENRARYDVLVWEYVTSLGTPREALVEELDEIRANRPAG